VAKRPDDLEELACSPRDSVDALIESWAERQPDLDFRPVGIITRLARVRAHLDSELEATFQEFDLTPASFAALVTLARTAGDHGVSQRQLADELGLTPGTVSVRVDRLIEQGLASRTPDPDTQRSSRVALTSKGRDLFDHVAPAHLDNEQRLLAALDEPEQQLLAGLLRKLLIEFEGSRPSSPAPGRLGMTVAPAHTTIAMRSAVGLAPVPGLLVRHVEPGQPAARAGIQPGDVLTCAGGRDLRSSASLYAALRESKNNTLHFDVLRGNKTLQASVTATTKDVSAAAPATGERPRHNDHEL